MNSSNVSPCRVVTPNRHLSFPDGWKLNISGETPWKLASEKLINRLRDLTLPEFKILARKVGAPRDRANLPAGAACIYCIEGSDSGCAPSLMPSKR